MPLYPDTLFWHWVDQSLLLLLNGREATNNNFNVFGVTQAGFKPTTSHTRSEQATDYTTEGVPEWMTSVHVKWNLLYVQNSLKCSRYWIHFWLALYLFIYFALYNNFQKSKLWGVINSLTLLFTYQPINVTVHYKSYLLELWYTFKFINLKTNWNSWSLRWNSSFDMNL